MASLLTRPTSAAGCLSSSMPRSCAALQVPHSVSPAHGSTAFEELRTLDGGDEFEAHGLGTEFGFLPLLVAQLVGGKTAVVEFLTGGNQVEDDASQFVCCGCDGLGGTKLGSHSS